MKLIPKYQTPWGKLNYRGPLYSEVLSLMKSENPLEYKRLITERAKSKLPNSEVVIDDEGNTNTNVGAGYMSGTDPLGEMYVAGKALDPAFRWLGKQALWGLGKTGNKWARSKIISKELNSLNPSSKINSIINLNIIKLNYTYGNHSGRVIHTDYGNNNPGFTKGTTGASVKNNKLYPGHNPNTKIDYSWWNTDKPYSTGINNKPFTRYIDMNESDIPNIINIRKLSEPIGLWNGKSGFVLNSERVSSVPVPLETANIMELDPLLKVYNRVKYVGNKLPKHLLETGNTVPAYFGPKYKISDVVNPDGTVNIKNALRIQQLVAKSHGVPNMLSRPENPKWHKTDPNTFLHTKQTTLRAYNMPTPEGYTKLEQVFAALGHDFGKMWAGDGHGPVGAGVLKQMFPNMSDDVYLAIYGHMRPLDLIKTSLGKYTKYADIGQTPPLASQFVGNNIKGEPLYMPDLEVFSKGKEMATKFFNHPVVRKSYKHNLELAKRLGVNIPDRNPADVVSKPVNVKLSGTSDGTYAETIQSHYGDPDALIRFNWMPMTRNLLLQASIHENLHRGYYSAAPRMNPMTADYYKNQYIPERRFYKWKTLKLLKPEYYDGYLGDYEGGEAGPNLIDLGRELGLKLGLKYPGYETVKDMLSKYNGYKKFIIPQLNDSRAGMRHVWDAMTGLYYVIPAIGAIGTLNKE